MENLKQFFIFLSLFFAIAVLVSSCAGKEATTKGTESMKTEETPGGDAKGIISGLIANKIPTYMVNYDITGAGDLSSMRIYSKSGKFRYDTVSHGNEAFLFFIDRKMYSCSESPKMCVYLGQQNETPKTGTEDVEKNLNSYDVVAKPSRVIAGTTAKCFELSSGEAVSEICYSKEGIPLYTKSTSQGNIFEMTATDYSTSVSDSVFELPAEPQDINALAAQYQQ
jgi:hypothetical protein